MSAKLFRYRSNGHYSVDSALNGKMFFVCPLELNDPFEFYIKYNIDKVYDLIQDNKKTKNIIATKIYKYYLDFGDINGFKTKPRTVKECLQLFDDAKETKQRLTSMIAKKVIQFKESFGIVSLTENPKEPVMWSHYSNDSKGFLEIYDAELLLSNYCSYIHHLGLDGYTKEQISVLKPRKVKYIKEFPERNELIVKLLCTTDNTNSNVGIDFIDNEDTAKQVVEVVTSKLSAWEYEKEIRLVLPCNIYNLNRKKKENGDIVHEHFFEETYGNPEKIILGSKVDTELEYALKYFCTTKKIKIEKSNSFLQFKIN